MYALRVTVSIDGRKIRGAASKVTSASHKLQSIVQLNDMHAVGHSNHVSYAQPGLLIVQVSNQYLPLYGPVDVVKAAIASSSAAKTEPWTRGHV